MPRSRLRFLLLSVALLVACSHPVRNDASIVAQVGESTETGALADAPYRIDMPARWNGELVMFLHGYEPVGTPRPDPWPRDGFAESLLARGFAVASSGYSAQGWAIAEAVADNERLRRHFVARHGQPGHTWLVGISMGGHAVLASAERHPGTYAGVLALCGVNAPASEMFTEAVLAPLAAFDAMFPKVLPQAPGGLADPSLPPMLDMDAVDAALRGDEGKARRMAERFDIPREALPGALMLQYVALRELTVRAGGFPVDNRDFAYRGFADDDELNRTVRRYAGDAAAMDYLRRNAPLTGKVDTPVVLQSNNHDPTVPQRFGNRYAQRMREAGNAHLLTVLPPVGEGHCALQPTDVDHAFDVLVHTAGTAAR